jgi:hypothetical protein
MERDHMLKPTFDTTSTRVFLWQRRELLTAEQPDPRQAVYAIKMAPGPIGIEWHNKLPKGMKGFFVLALDDQQNFVRPLTDVVGPVEGGEKATVTAELPADRQGDLILMWTFITGDQTHPTEPFHIAMTAEKRSLIAMWTKC